MFKYSLQYNAGNNGNTYVTSNAGLPLHNYIYIYIYIYI